MKQTDLHYIGAVRTPTEQATKFWPEQKPNQWGVTDGLNYAGHPFTCDFRRREFVLGTKGKRVVRLKMVAPTLPKRATTGDTQLLDRTSVPAAPYVDGVMVDLTNNTWPQIHDQGTSQGEVFMGIQVMGDRALITASTYYDASNACRRNMLLAEWPLTEPRQVTVTPWRSVGPTNQQGHAAGPLCLIPDRYRSVLKGDTAAFLASLPIVSRQSAGPGFNAFWTKDLLTMQDVPRNQLMQYSPDKGIPGHPWSNKEADDYYSQATSINGFTFINDSVIYVGSHGYGKPCYGTGQECSDPTGDAKGTHAYPYRVQAWVYPASDLAAVAAGTKKADSLTPTWFPIELPWFAHQHYKLQSGALPRISINGIAYDSQECLLYVCAYAQDSYGYEPGPLIHVFKVISATPEPLPSLPQLGATTPSEPPLPDPTPELDELRKTITTLTAERDSFKASWENSVQREKAWEAKMAEEAKITAAITTERDQYAGQLQNIRAAVKQVMEGLTALQKM